MNVGTFLAFYGRLLAEKIRLFCKRKSNFQTWLKRPEATECLSYLANFCSANRSTWRSDPHEASVMEGRRQVFLFLLHHMADTPAEKEAEIYVKAEIIAKHFREYMPCLPPTKE
ncbi:hypothetical protein [Candidatus Liberibacter sp.]|uniref:Bbp19 family protein n=1 Tax=Candidatus Liberibacter sp. TaxID=34022 RepID=UPI0015F58A98|nr:hypothetical protein [Candidatus Liberibacter sp.]MBA5724581.1 hypothetical protein [Candidatus Liberibacter sp.]